MSSLSLESPLVAIPLFSALAFLIVASPVVFKFTDAKLAPLLRTDIASPSGVPTRAGLVLHAVVLALLVSFYLKSYASGGSSLYCSVDCRLMTTLPKNRIVFIKACAGSLKTITASTFYTVRGSCSDTRRMSPCA